MIERAIRLAWTALSVSGAIFALANWRDAAGDYQAVRQFRDYRPDGPRAIAGRANIRREQLRLITQVAFTAVGVQSILAPGPPPPPHAGRVVSILGIILGQGCVVINDVLDRNDRRKAIRSPIYRRRETDG